MTTVHHRFVESASGLRMHVAEAGEGPLVLLLHGFPESWYSWRHQLIALAEAGYHAVAPDQRGYGRTGGPDAVEQYTLHHLAGDALGLIPALGHRQAAVVGHDWGAPVAWHTALVRPDAVRAVAGLSVPPFPRGAAPATEVFRRLPGGTHYMLWFQQVGPPEAELARDPGTTFRRLLAGRAALAPGGLPMVPEGGGFLDLFEAPADLPGWLTEDDLAFFAAEFAEHGFHRPLHWYRNLDRNWELGSPWQTAVIRPPALYIAGERDLVVANPATRQGIAGLTSYVPQLRAPVWLPGCGHWTQQEKPAEVNAALLAFLASLD
ncbi:alpha/beta fold hydrolase [Kitasatospora sp. NBC_01539]|uniref:alpha/beta fold hydrolase n=1 Tax=Kitasatospora sp. NBC_01539 TaxID=2903577 RepID=UPI0038603162